MKKLDCNKQGTQTHYKMHADVSRARQFKEADSASWEGSGIFETPRKAKCLERKSAAV